MTPSFEKTNKTKVSSKLKYLRVPTKTLAFRTSFKEAETSILNKQMNTNIMGLNAVPRTHKPYNEVIG